MHVRKLDVYISSSNLTIISTISFGTYYISCQSAQLWLKILANCIVVSLIRKLRVGSSLIDFLAVLSTIIIKHFTQVRRYNLKLM